MDWRAHPVFVIDGARSDDPAALLRAISDRDLHEVRMLARPATMIELAFEAAIATAAAGPETARVALASIARSLLARVEYCAFAADEARDIAARLRECSLLWKPGEERTVWLATQELKIRTAAGRLLPWSLVSGEVTTRRVLEALSLAVDFDRPLPAASPLLDYLCIAPFTPHNGRNTAGSALACFLHAAADPAVRVDRALTRRRPVLCAVAARHRRGGQPAEGFAGLCLRLALMGATGASALDGALWRAVVGFL